MVHVRKHSTIKMRELFDRYFSKENVMAASGRFYGFTKEEQENIKNGTIARGMRKDAVLMAYGYPPSHVTRSLSSNIWTYWRNRARRIIVQFDSDGRVSRIVK